MEEFSDAEASDIENRFAEFGYSSNISALRIKGSGYRKLTHRDFLGSVLGLGLERSVVGDIFVMGDGESEAIMLCDSAIADFLLNELSHIENDKVRVSSVRHGEWEAPKRRMREIHDTVASPRLDAVVAALCNLSREKASQAVLGGLVEVDYESETRSDRTLTAPCLISVRGYGKFRINSVSEQTRRGRLRLDADKYV
jgi:RNA-binding protein YlmH